MGLKRCKVPERITRIGYPGEVGVGVGVSKTKGIKRIALNLHFFGGLHFEVTTNKPVVRFESSPCFDP
jgi:hypothetical protein